jgi:glucose-1-phosphate thymidylyltransferase
MAIIGIYYVKDGARLREEIQYLLDNDIKDKGEYQLTNALDNMKNKGYRFKPAPVNRWMDCGNKNATVDTNAQILEVRKDAAGTAGSAKLTDAVVVQPCYIGEGVVIERSVVGPYVSLEANARVSDSRLSQSIVMEHSVVANAVLHNTMVGKHVQYHPSPVDASVGDYTQVRSS